MHKKAKWLISTLLTLIAPAALKSQSLQGQNPHGISIESLCSKRNQQQIEMLTRFAEERGGWSFPETIVLPWLKTF